MQEEQNLEALLHATHMSTKTVVWRSTGMLCLPVSTTTSTVYRFLQPCLKPQPQSTITCLGQTVSSQDNAGLMQKGKLEVYSMCLPAIPPTPELEQA